MLYEVITNGLDMGKGIRSMGEIHGIGKGGREIRIHRSLHKFNHAGDTGSLLTFVAISYNFV